MDQAAELELELLQLAAAPLTCARCRTPWPEHNNGGAVRVKVGGWSSPAAAVPVTCPGFLWVELGGPPVGSYLEPPAAGFSASA